ncbi:MAG TPA: hypothetical protein VF777_10355 [Phycisphaerales bacterium]
MSKQSRVAGVVACCAAVAGQSLAAPPVQPGHDMDVLSGGPQSPLPITVVNNQIVWVAFTLSNGFSPTPGVSLSTGLPLTAVTFMDITMQAGSAYNVDWNFGLYNSFGVLVASSLAALGPDGPSGGGGSYAQLSFGLQTPRPTLALTGPQTTFGLALANQNNPFVIPPHLPPDIYYLAIAAGPTATFANNFAASGSFTGGAVTAMITIDSDNRGKCPLNPCDLNSDGAVDTDDFVLFAAAYQAFLSRTGDFNNDSITDDTDYVIFVNCFSNLFSGC